MSKITIAAATLAGLAISDRLSKLEIRDEVLANAVGDLAEALGAATAALEHIDVAIRIIAKAQLEGDEDCVMEGLAAVKGQIEDLVSDQDKVKEEMFKGLSDDERALMELLAMLGSMR